MRDIKVLYLPHPVGAVEQKNSFLSEQMSEKFNLRIFDRSAALNPQFDDIEVIVDLGGNITAELISIAAHAGVKYIQVQTNGLDHVEVEEILDAGITLAHCPGDLSSVSLAEGAMMFILMLAHGYGFATDEFFQGKIFSFLGMEVAGRSLGILGFGASGQQLARRAKAFGMRVHGIDIRKIEKAILEEIRPDSIGGPEDLDNMIATCDFISVHLHLNKDTRHIINSRRIALMKPTAFIINVARGGLIDEEALYKALLEDRIAGAGLDAFAQEPPDYTLPVYKLPNVLVQPHTVSSTDGTMHKRADFAVDNLIRYAEGKDLEGLISKRI
jgi:lactate dehydrogenase-like 2-hydroxyacid dehydrogenase